MKTFQPETITQGLKVGILMNMDALIIIDIQNEYFKGGKRELFQPEAAADNAKRLLDHFREKNRPVFFIQHISTQEGATAFLPGSNGADIHSSISPGTKECVLVKHAPNSFYQTGLSERLMEMGIHHLVICGLMSHMCIDTTVRAARDFGFTVTLIHDACTTMDLTWNSQVIPAQTVHNVFMAALSGSFAKVISTDEYLSGGGL